MITNPDEHQNIVPTSANCKRSTVNVSQHRGYYTSPIDQINSKREKNPDKTKQPFLQNELTFTASKQLTISSQTQGAHSNPTPTPDEQAPATNQPQRPDSNPSPAKRRTTFTAVYIISNGLGQSLFAGPVRLHMFLTGSTNRRVDNRSITKLAHSDSRGTDKFRGHCKID